MLRSPGAGTALRDERTGIAANEGDFIGRYEAVSGKNGLFARLGLLGSGRMEGRTASVEEFGRYHRICKRKCDIHISQKPGFSEAGRDRRVDASAGLLCQTTLNGITNDEIRITNELPNSPKFVIRNS